MPLLVGCLITLQVFTYSLVRYIAHNYSILGSNWHVEREFYQEGEALQFYVLLLVCCVMLSFFKHGGRVGGNYDVLNSMIPFLRRYSYVVIGVIILIGALHFMIVDFSFIERNVPYTWLRSPSELGFFGGWGMLHTIGKLVPTLSVLVLFYVRSRVSIGALTLLIITALYFEIVLMLSLSKWAAMPLGCAAFLLVFNGNKKWGILTFIIFIYVFLLMVGARHSGLSGYDQIVATLVTQTHVSLGVALVSLINLFNGVFNYAAVLELPEFTYSAKFQVLSFSPLPSFIDGYESVLHEGGKIVIFKPVAGISQLKYFHPLLQFAFCAQLVMLIRKVDNLRFLSKQLFVTAAALLVLGLMAINVYYLRTGIRFFYMAWIIVLFATWVRRIDERV